MSKKIKRPFIPGDIIEWRYKNTREHCGRYLILNDGEKMRVLFGQRQFLHKCLVLDIGAQITYAGSEKPNTKITLWLWDDFEIPGDENTAYLKLISRVE